MTVSATSLVWSPTDGHPDYRWSSSLFLRALGAIHFFAFLSIAAQIVPLLGEAGILPAAHYLDRVASAIPDERFFRVPTLFWIDASDAALFGVAITGAALGAALTIGIRRRLVLALLWALYLSISSVGRTFLAFQWDILLLEVTVVGFFLASPSGPRPSAMFLGRLLLWKLMFLSGFAKWHSGDPTWRELSALFHHYQTQPLPTILGWWAHQLPDHFQRASVAAMFGIQLIVPFMVFVPRLRRLAFFPLAGLQLLISLTGNYGFFNLLTLALCLLLLDDRFLAGRLPASLAALWPMPMPTKTRPSLKDVPVAGIVALQLVLLWGRFFGVESLPGPAATLLEQIQPFRSVNGYGLFAVMTTERREIVLEGSRDGVTWRPYVLPHQPGPLDRAPSWSQPHMPRLDWQMWFAALGEPRQSPWLFAFVDRLLEGVPEVRGLLAVDPFGDEPPEKVRAKLYRYRFTTIAERAATGAYWQREDLGDYFPARSLSGNL